MVQGSPSVAQSVGAQTRGHHVTSNSSFLGDNAEVTHTSEGSTSDVPRGREASLSRERAVALDNKARPEAGLSPGSPDACDPSKWASLVSTLNPKP